MGSRNVTKFVVCKMRPFCDDISNCFQLEVHYSYSGITWHSYSLVNEPFVKVVSLLVLHTVYYKVADYLDLPFVKLQKFIFL